MIGEFYLISPVINSLLAYKVIDVKLDTPAPI